ncbi:TPA_asm: major head protein [Caudoviricetes sp. vir519]|nr:TPA_asm: major head protein [Caudoviricetes sp. vir519]
MVGIGSGVQVNLARMPDFYDPDAFDSEKWRSATPMERMMGYYYNQGQNMVYFDETGTLRWKRPIQNADDFMTTTTTGFKNIVYGMRLIQQFLAEWPTTKLIGSEPWGDQSGFRAVTEAGTYPAIGQAEGGAIPEAGMAVLQPIEVDPCHVAAAYGHTLVSDALQNKDDNLKVMPFNRDQAEQYLRAAFNEALWKELGTDTGDDPVSIDKIVSSNSEVTDIVGYDVTDADFYNILRSDGDSVFDSWVLHNDGVDRALTLDLVDALIDACKPYWADRDQRNNKIFITGDDTFRTWSNLVKDEQQLMEKQWVQIDKNGIRITGKEGGFLLNTYERIPIFTDADIPADGLSRLFLLDLDHLTWKMLVPPTDMFSSDYLALQIWASKGVYFWLGQTYCDKPNAHGKLRDLTSAA